MDIEKVVSSLLMHDLLSFQQYTLTEEMFTQKSYKTYINHLVKNKGTKDTHELNQIFLTKQESNKDLFMSLFELEKLLDVFKIKTMIELLYKNAIKHLIKSKFELIDGSLSDKNALEEIEEILKEIQELISKLNKQAEEKDPIDSYEKFLAGVVSRQADTDSPYNNNIVGVTTGIYPLDMITKGLKEAEYVIMAGRPSMGKTSVALDMAAANIKDGNGVIIFSVEMPAEQIVARLLPKINRRLTLNNTLYGENYDQVKDEIFAALSIIKNAKLLIEDFQDYSSVTTNELEEIAMDFIKKHGSLELVVLDYVQLLSSTIKSSDENAQLTETSRRIKGLCKKTEAPWIVLSQLSRSLEQRADKRPMNSDLRSSGSLEQDADLIIFPYRENVYTERALREQLSKKPDNQALLEALEAIKTAEIENAEIIVSKNRNGPLGTAPVHFHKASASYVNIGEMDLYDDDLIDL